MNDMEAAFAKSMQERSYGVEETDDARAWFNEGYCAAIKYVLWFEDKLIGKE